MTTLAGHKEAARSTWERADWRALDRFALLGCVTVGLIVGLAQATGAIADPYDARAYWEADPANLYLAHWIGGYVYPPPLALFVNVLHPLGWPVFITAFTTATWTAFWYCARAWSLPVLLASLALVPLIGGNVVGYLFLGNIQILMAAAVVASVRHPAWAALPLLTKGVGVSFVWYAVRREWRSLGIAVGTTAAVVAVTFVAAPEAWFAFYRFVTDNGLTASPIPLVPVPFAVRLVAATALVAWGGLTDRRWTLPIAAGIAIPALYVWSFLAVWVGVIGVTTGRSSPRSARWISWPRRSARASE